MAPWKYLLSFFQQQNQKILFLNSIFYFCFLYQVCFFGRKRTYSASQESEFDERRSDFINDRCKKQKLETFDSSLGSSYTCATQTEEIKEPESSALSAQPKDVSESWISGFQPRILPKTSGMCKNVPGDIKTKIVDTVIEKLMSAENSIILPLSDGRTWHKGGKSVFFGFL